MRRWPLQTTTAGCLLGVVLAVAPGKSAAEEPAVDGTKPTAAEAAKSKAAEAGPFSAPTTAETLASTVRWNADIRLRGGQFWQDLTPTNNAALGATADDRAGGFQRARLGVALERETLRAGLEVQAEGSSGNLAAASAHLQQAWAEAGWGTRTRLQVRGGRQRLQVASGLLVGAYDVSDRGRVFDAVEVTVRHTDTLLLRALGSRAQPLDASDTRRRLAGLALHAQPHERLGVDVHLLGHGDEVGNQRWRMLTLGAGLQVRPLPRLTAAAEGALQAGDVRTTGQKTGTDQLAAMGRVEVAFGGPVTWPWRLTGQLTVWSGDTEPADQVQRAFRPLFGNLDEAVGWLRLWRPSGLRQGVLRGRLPLGDHLQAEAEWRWSQIVAADAAPWLGSDRSWRFAGHEPLVRLAARVGSASWVSATAGNWLQRLPSRPDVSQVWLEWRSRF